VLTTGILVVQFVMRWLEKLILRARRATAPGRFELRVDCDGETYPTVNATLERRDDLIVLRRTVQRGPENLTFRAAIRTPDSTDLTSLEEQLVALPGVKKVDVWHLGIEDE
jgi:uncharacterized membrane protein YhiD involved in acid resistance